MRKSKSKKMNQNKGFTLAESMMVLAMLSIIIVLVMPVMTSRKIMPEQEQNSVTCIKKEGAANTSSVACAAVEDLCVGNQAKSCSSLMYFADNGKTADKVAARKVLHEVCDKGGREACKYLVDSCKKDAAVCDISTTTDDMRHYLAMSNSSGNMGRGIVKEIANGYYLLGNSNITAELVSSCNGGNDKTSCSILIENCNNGYGCSNAYNANANRSCKQIHEKWPTAIGKNQKKSDYYSLKIDTNPPVDMYCEMVQQDGGWTRLGDYKVLAQQISTYTSPLAYNQIYAVWVDDYISCWSNHANGCETNAIKFSNGSTLYRSTRIYKNAVVFGDSAGVTGKYNFDVFDGEYYDNPSSATDNSGSFTATVYVK